MEWNEPLYKEGVGDNARVGVLVSHGFTGSPHSMHELGLQLTDAGYTVALPLLAGHGRTPEQLEKVTWTEWTEDVERTYEWLRKRTDTVLVSGLSMGGTLALWMAQHHPEVAGVVTVNAAVRHPQELLMRAFGRLGFPRWAKAVGNDARLEGVDERAYDRVPMRAARQFALILAAVRRDLSLVHCPALVFSSAVDHVVPPANQHEIYEKISSKHKALVKLHNSYHVATMDNDKKVVFAKTLEFLASHAGGRQ
ncbi:MAG: alpha/beta fold hydrolase [Thermoleophilia bacterium]|nr:alpha/beta fold hydrolase [Thermoleophilia bacterium]